MASAKQTTIKDLEKAGFDQEQPAAPQRLIVSVAAKEKQGKSHFSLTSPKPIAYYNIDSGVAEVLPKFGLSKSQFLHYHVDYDNEDPDQTERQVDAMIKSYRLALTAPDELIQTIVFDTDTEFWEMIRLARFGKLTQVKPHHYGPVNNEYRNLIRSAFRSNKNLILLHKKKKEYKTNKKGEDAWTGKYTRAGFAEIGYLVQVSVELFKDEDGFNCQIMECRQNPACEGEILTTPYVDEDGMGMCDFPHLACTVYPETDLEDWG